MTVLDSRRNGVLMGISSLPGSTGIGTMGKNAYKFVDLLHDAGQTYWQILPICPTGYGDSPYQSFSTFAGNPYFIDFDMLAEQGFLSKADYENVDWGSDEHFVDYGLLYVNRKKVFEILVKKFAVKSSGDFDSFCEENSFWLDDYSLFMAVKDAHGGAAFSSWEDGIRCRTQEALKVWTEKESERINYYKVLQYFFYKQWGMLKKYANSKGIKIIGDVPIYVSGDSSDAWASPSCFLLDQNLVPTVVAGCPPDAFSPTGQLWGNPVYNWDYMKKTDYDWWKKRLAMSLKSYDVIRLDHFRGFESFYTIPYGSKDACRGSWLKGPGMDLFNSLKKSLGEFPVIAEDLGFLTPEVKQLLEDSGFPGMKVLQFAFDSREESDYLPYRYTRNSVVYTGTHDNDTILGWIETASKEDVAVAVKYYRIENAEKLREEMMISAMESVSNTCILTMQDLIGIGREGRMNIPATEGGNWKWRATMKEIDSVDFKKLGEFTKIYGRK